MKENNEYIKDKNIRLVELFKEIQSNRDRFIAASKGKDFEKIFIEELMNIGFNSMNKNRLKYNIKKRYGENTTKKDEIDLLKDKVQDKKRLDLITNPFSEHINNTFIYQPYGSQNFPDFLIFLKKYILPIEMKFTTKPKKNPKASRPVWNSNLPKEKAIYIYGIANTDITFFLGEDVISSELRNLLINSFTPLKETQQSFIENNLKNNFNKKGLNDFGWAPYVRIAYEQKAKVSTHNDDKKSCESFFSTNREMREDKVIKFIKRIVNY